MVKSSFIFVLILLVYVASSINGAAVKSRGKDKNIKPLLDKLASLKIGSSESGSIESGSSESGSIESGSIESGSIESGSIESGSSESESGSKEKIKKKKGTDEDVINDNIIPDGRKRDGLIRDLNKQLKEVNATTGPIQITLSWKNINDIDLWVIDPFNDLICWYDRTSESGGFLDLDLNSYSLTNTALENVAWPTTYPNGTYYVLLDFYAYRGVEYNTTFNLFIKVNNDYTVIQDILNPDDRIKLFYIFTV